ncbi:glutathione transferase [Pontibacillus halophilus JSM 076056 = DSM 19796]|uniref:Glutathione transferase n=1 Tax=Pontibacillus halophilus JSM 076056 = DSM 19796 TaxID=1385510 RepID=A0A0A5GDQ5_9BACI|nr:VOC family protein [Pontibacillus halophilus]KGX91346.1 glutathione transferase [Pontibacillus halophilus JSM 076056 = DSM 19796]
MIKGLYEAHLPVKDRKKALAFYEGLGLPLAFEGHRVTFVWIEKGKSWLGLWDSDEVNLPYHPSIRHIAFQVDKDDLRRSQEWLDELGIEVKTTFGVSPEDQPLVLSNLPHGHGAIYFDDPDGNSLELIPPLELDTYEEREIIPFEEWDRATQRGNG